MQARADSIDYNTSNLCEEYDNCCCCIDENICMQAYNYHENGFDIFQHYSDGEATMSAEIDGARKIHISITMEDLT